MDPTIFKAYDIRGEYPSQINKDNIKQLAQIYYSVVMPKKVVVGHDSTQGSIDIYLPLVSELSELGVEVHKGGELTSPMLYWVSGELNFEHSVFLTASHLGPNYTGMKMNVSGLPLDPKKIIEMKNLCNQEIVINKSALQKVSIIDIPNIKQEYEKKVITLFGISENLNRCKVVIDSSNGTNGFIISNIVSALDLNADVINEEVKSSNLAHETNPKLAKNREQLVNSVIHNKADFGVIWDGDADRAYFVDSNGIIIPPEFIGSMIGSNMVDEGKMTTMTIDIRASRAVEDIVESHGGKIKRIVAWHVPIKEEMSKDENIGFGMETSGHYVFRDMHKSDDGLFTFLAFLKAICINEKSLNKLLSEFREKYLILEEINFETSITEQQAIEHFTKIYKDGKISLIDGFTVDYPSWRFNIRESKTEPILRLNISGTDKLKVEENLKQITSFVENKR